MNLAMQSNRPRWNQLFAPAFILLLIALSGLYLWNAWQATHAAPVSPATVLVTPAKLESQYGLRVNMLAVTAAGGLVDLRLKFVDAEKARALLQDRKNFPALWVADSGLLISAPEETRAQEIKIEKDGSFFVMFSNPGGSVKPGTSVSVIFGDVQVESFQAR